MSEKPLTQCPVCGQPVYKIVSRLGGFKVMKSPVSDEKIHRRDMQRRLGRKVEKGEQFHTVPVSGEVVKLDGKPRAQQQEEIFNAHARAKDAAIEGLTPADIDPQTE